MEIELARSKSKSVINSSFSIDRLLGSDARDNGLKSTPVQTTLERQSYQDPLKIPRSILHRHTGSGSEKLYRPTPSTRAYHDVPSSLERYPAQEGNFDCRLLHPSCYRPTFLPSFPVGNLCLHRPSPCFSSTPSAFINPIAGGLPLSSTYLGCPEVVSYKEKDCITTVDYPCRRPSFDDKDESRRKGGQIRFSHIQSMELERVFSHQKYISPQERKQLARALELSERQVKTWFQNRRAKWRRIRMEAEMRERMARDTRIRELENSGSDDEQYFEKEHEDVMSPGSSGNCDMSR